MALLNPAGHRGFLLALSSPNVSFICEKILDSELQRQKTKLSYLVGIIAAHVMIHHSQWIKYKLYNLSFIPYLIDSP